MMQPLSHFSAKFTLSPLNQKDDKKSDIIVNISAPKYREFISEGDFFEAPPQDNDSIINTQLTIAPIKPKAKKNIPTYSAINIGKIISTIGIGLMMSQNFFTTGIILSIGGLFTYGVASEYAKNRPVKQRISPSNKVT